MKARAIFENEHVIVFDKYIYENRLDILEVFNKTTNMVSTKLLYTDKKGNRYINLNRSKRCRNVKKLIIGDFVEEFEVEVRLNR